MSAPRMSFAADLGESFLYGRWDDFGRIVRKTDCKFCVKGVCYASCLGSAISLIVVNTSSCFGPNGRGQLTRHRYDPSGGFVPGAAIEIRNAEQGRCELYYGR